MSRLPSPAVTSAVGDTIARVDGFFADGGRDVFGPPLQYRDSPRVELWARY